MAVNVVQQPPCLRFWLNLETEMLVERLKSLDAVLQPLMAESRAQSLEIDDIIGVYEQAV